MAVNQSSLRCSKAAQLARQIKALAHPANLAILRILAAHPETVGGEELAIMVSEETGGERYSQPGISHRVRELSDAGLLAHAESRRYRVATDEFQSLLGTLCNYTGITQANEVEYQEPGKTEP